MRKDLRISPAHEPPSAASQNKIVVAVTRQLTWLSLLVLDCFWSVSNSMIFTCYWLKGGGGVKSKRLCMFIVVIYIREISVGLQFRVQSQQGGGCPPC